MGVGVAEPAAEEAGLEGLEAVSERGERESRGCAAAGGVAARSGLPPARSERLLRTEPEPALPAGE